MNVRTPDDCWPLDPNYPQPCSSKELERGEISNAHTLGKIRVTHFSTAERANVEAGTDGGGKTMLLLKEKSWVQVSAPPLTCRIIIGNVSASKHLVCKMGTSIMVLGATAVWARDKGPSASP